MLMNNFYTVSDTVQGDNTVSHTVSFDAAHEIFNGHFPGQPVVPGVCMMEMVKELLQQQVGKSLWLRNASNVKFLQLITPDIKPSIAINWKQHDKGYKVDATFKHEAVALFKLSGYFEPR